MRVCVCVCVRVCVCVCVCGVSAGMCKIATKGVELICMYVCNVQTGDPNQKGPGKGNARVAEHKSLAMYDAFGAGGGEGWGGGGGTRGDDYDFM